MSDDKAESQQPIAGKSVKFDVDESEGQLRKDEKAKAHAITQ